MSNTAPTKADEFKDTLDQFVNEQIGLDLAWGYATQDMSQIACGMQKEYRIKNKGAEAINSKTEFRDMADELMEKLERWPWEMKYEVTSLSRNGFELTRIEKEVD